MGIIMEELRPSSIIREEFTISEFLSVEDKDLQKFIYINYPINTESKVERTENDDRIAYYLSDKAMRVNSKGSFYVQSKLKEYIFYDKKMKKVRVSKMSTNVYNSLMKDYFYDIHIIDRWFPKLTPTFCKKVIEGKINTLGDIIQYHKSYTIRNKNLTLEAIYKFMIGNGKYLLNVIEDPENLQEWNELTDVDIDEQIIHLKPFKFKIKDAGKTKEQYNRWLSEQSKKYATFSRCRNEKNGNSDGEVSSQEISNISDKISPF